VRSPHVAYLLKKFPRLSETFVLNEILGQERLGRRLHVFSRRAADDEPRHPELARLEARVEVLPARRQLDPWGALFRNGDSGDLIERVGSVVRDTLVWRHPRLPELLGEALHLRRRTRELDIRHVHVHFATDAAVVAMILRVLGGPGYSLTVHAKDIYRSTVDPGLLERVFLGSEFAVTVCDANVRHLRGLIGAEAGARVRRLYNGIDLEAFVPVLEDREPAHVLAVGRLVEKKGFDVLLAALQRLRASTPELRATIVGEGEERARLEQEIGARGLTDVVRLAGALDQDGVRAALRTATVMCLPCVVGADGNRDALPTVLLEALAAGLPVVSTPVTGIPEIVDNGRAGVLVPERDPEATARALAELLDAPPERDRLARAGRRRAEEEFDARRISVALHGWFDEALADGREPCASPA
jgi:glycosyltransferase involved in cell wall biosynthesis